MVGALFLSHWGRMFNGIWLVATDTLTIRGREIQPGERFEVPRVRSGDYLLTNRAILAPRLVPKADSAAEPPPPEEPPVARKRGRPRKTPAVNEGSPAPRTYRRRDMEAE